MADPRQEPGNTAYSEPPRFAPPERRKREIPAAAVAIGAVLLLLIGAAGGYYLKSDRAARAAAPAAEAPALPIFQSRSREAPPPLEPPAATPLPAPADASADRMMPVVPTNDRMMFAAPDESGPSAPALKPTHLPTDVQSKSIKAPNSVDLRIKNPRGVIEAVVVEINELQTNRYAIQAMPDQKLSLPLPDLPVFQLVYKLVAHDGTVITKDMAAFQRDGSVWVSPEQVNPSKRGYSVSAAYVGPFHLKH